MDPTVIKKTTQMNRGELQLSFKFDEKKELLLIKVIRARDLAPSDLLGKTADPYVKVYVALNVN